MIFNPFLVSELRSRSTHSHTDMYIKTLKKKIKIEIEPLISVAPCHLNKVSPLL